jgi:hypothetical protein
MVAVMGTITVIVVITAGSTKFGFTSSKAADRTCRLFGFEGRLLKPTI